MRIRENTRATSWKLEKIWTNDNTELNLKSAIGKTKTQSIYIIEPAKDSGSTSGSGSLMGLKIGWWVENLKRERDPHSTLPNAVQSGHCPSSSPFIYSLEGLNRRSLDRGTIGTVEGKDLLNRGGRKLKKKRKKPSDKTHPSSYIHTQLSFPKLGPKDLKISIFKVFQGNSRSNHSVAKTTVAQTEFPKGGIPQAENIWLQSFQATF